MNEKIFEEIAKQNGVSVEEVKKEMQAAIDVAYENPNLYAAKVPKKGDKPTPDELIAYLSNEAKDKMKEQQGNN